MRMNSWPSAYLPPLADSFTLPPLHVKATSGESVLDFKSGDKFTMYVCGITPYDATHLGHAATYLTFDLINRYLRARGSAVSFVENITDIDDPLLERATRDNVDWTQLADSQIDLFRSDMSALHILPPDHFVPVTQTMDLVENALTRLISQGFTYKVDNDFYFDTSIFLKDLPIAYEEALKIFSERGGDPDRPGKRDRLDPILWIAARPGEPAWESSLGKGRPGWHIECSVIALRYLLGESYLNQSDSPTHCISLQGGGSDLIFPHHFMSAAQVQALTGRDFARTFVHTGMVGLDGEKMSKSKGNLVFVSKLLNSGEDAMVIRHALLSSHYSSDRMWTEQVLQTSRERVAKIREALSKQYVSGSAELINSVISALAQDLNTPFALAAIDSWANSSFESESSTESPGEVSRALDLLLGLAL